MRILFSVHLYPPTHNCGGEYYIHNLAKWLITQGHQIRVLLHQAKRYGIVDLYTIDGVEVFPPTAHNSVEQNLFWWCDVAISHLEYTSWTFEMARIFKKPAVQIVHNDTPYQCVLGAYTPVNIIYNSQWIADKLKYDQRSMVLSPPVDYRFYDSGKDPVGNECITLINLNKNKGGHILTEIARMMPERQFLAVKGSYDPQILPELPNVQVIDNTSNILPVYDRTRVLLMPSKYESWGMTATEAMCNGIPVICARTPGLLENCGENALYCERDDIGAWVAAIRKLDNKKTYAKYSVAARARSRELDPLIGFKKAEDFLHGAVR